jgi:hypothetical protein
MHKVETVYIVREQVGKDLHARPVYADVAARRSRTQAEFYAFERVGVEAERHRLAAPRRDGLVAQVGPYTIWKAARRVPARHP